MSEHRTPRFALRATQGKPNIEHPASLCELRRASRTSSSEVVDVFYIVHQPSAINHFPWGRGRF
ncbi:MAG: hypothetical protein KJ626_05010 [Verrucomicrobia bacterium]|nr:hypothetical protein [Verrucomicrobiota bacterium]